MRRVAWESTGMAIVAGIDEAGFGPVLGPLAVTVSALRVRADLVGRSLWEALAAVAVRRPDKKGLKVAFADSKKLYGRKKKAGLGHLERGVLGMLAAKGRTPASLAALVHILAPGLGPQAARYPWYGSLDLPIPVDTSATSVALAGNALATEMARAHVDLVAIRSAVLLAGEYNRFVSATTNKSATLLDATLSLLTYLWDKAGAEPLFVYADRQGGRKRYRRALQRAFGACELKILDESDACSAYRLQNGPRMMELRFLVGGEEQHLPVALSSMVCKYLRELFLILLNAFWAERVEGLKPTAGYYVDGHRFFDQIRPALAELGVEADLLYRCR